MKVTCSTVSELIENLKLEPTAVVHGGAIYVSRVRAATVAGKNPMVFAIDVQVTCVVVKADGSEYLLAAGESCGKDFLDGSPGLAGSYRANQVTEELRQYCIERGWTVRPGVCSE